MAGYTRQSTFADGDTITAALFNNEYNQLVNAFSNTSGHSHDGTAASGPVIGLIGDAGETSPNNKVLIDTTNNFIEFYVQVSSSSVQQLYIADGAIIPVTDSDIDLGTTSLRFKDTYTDTITTTGNVAVGGNLTVTGTTTFNGGTITMGDAATDNVVFGADVDSHIIPDDDDTYDLGSSTQEWRNLYIDGTAHIDTLDVDVNATVAGTLGVTGVLTGTSLDISGDIDVDGTTNLDVVDIDGAVDMATTLTVGGEITAASLDISGNVDIDGILEADAITVNGTTLAETISDTVGAMVSSNTETNITVSYDDADNTLDFVIGTLNQNTTGNAATATALQTARTIHGVSFDGTANIDLTEVVQDTVGAMFTSNTESGITVAYQDADGTVDFTVGTLNQDTTGNAATATALATARTIGGTSFDGTSNIAVNLSATTTALATARTIGGVSFDGTANIVPTTFNAATFSGDLNVDSGVLFADVSTNRVGINQTTPDVSLDLGANTDAVHVPVGTTAQRPTSPAAGYFRYNTTTGGFEGYTDAWGAIAGGGGGGTAPSLDTMTGDGSDTTLTLSTTPINENATFVTIDGVLQHKDTYSISGNTLTFSEAPPNTSKVEAITLTATSSTTANILSDADADTKVQVEESSDEDKIRFDTGGTQRMIIDSTGVGIGTTSPTYSLDVSSSSALASRIQSSSGETILELNNTNTNGRKFMIISGGNSGSLTGGKFGIFDATAVATRLAIDSSGNVGIGTASPSAPLHILKSATGINAATDMLKLSSVDTNLAYYVGFQAQRDNSAGQGLNILTTNVSGTVSESMRISPSGNVGIGTSAPSNPLHVNSSSTDVAKFATTGAYTFVTLDNATRNWALSAGSTFSIYDSTAAATRMSINSSGNLLVGTANATTLGTVNKNLVVGSTTNNDEVALTLNVMEGTHNRRVKFFLDDDDGVFGLDTTASSSVAPFVVRMAGSEKLRLDTAGNVGIGTAPADKLHVEGNIYLGTSGRTIYTGGSGALTFQTNTGPTIFLRSNGSSESMRVDSSGNLLVGTTSPTNITSGTLQVHNTQAAQIVVRNTNASSGKAFKLGVDSSANNFTLYNNSGSGVYITDGGTSWTSNSDENLKENIVELTGALDKVKNYRCVEYNFIADKTNSKKIGFIAQDWKEDYSQVVSQNENGNLGIQYTETIPVLLKAIQEQQTQIDVLQSEINKLKGE